MQPQRAALFYIPPMSGPLPEKEDPGLISGCVLGAVWRTDADLNEADRIVRELTSAHGQPNGATGQPDIQGYARWNSVASWHIADIDVWVARDSTLRTVFYMRRKMPTDWEIDHWFATVLESQAELAGDAAQIAALGPALTEPVLGRSRCSAGPGDRTGDWTTPLNTWLRAARGLSNTRQAAALLLADFYITCAGTASLSDPFEKQMIRLGAKYTRESDYAHNFRDRAERMDPRGPAGELAALVSLTDPCFLKGNRPWPELVVDKSAKMLAAFPGADRTPYVRYIMARAQERLGRRAAAIGNFREFVLRKPETHEAAFAWQEAWRLLAGLPPGHIDSGCTGE